MKIEKLVLERKRKDKFESFFLSVSTLRRHAITNEVSLGFMLSLTLHDTLHSFGCREILTICKSLH